MMKKNMGNADRTIRVLAAIIFVVLYFTGTVKGIWGIVFLVLSAIFLLTSLIRFCPLYAMVGINTCNTKHTTENV